MWLTLPILILLSVSVFAQRNLDVCRVTNSTWDSNKTYGTGILELGKFPVTPSEDSTEETFEFAEGNLFANVSIRFDDTGEVERGKASRIQLTMSVTSSPSNRPWKDSDHVVGGTSYGHKWGSVFIQMDVKKGDSIYQFTLECSDGISKFGVKRGETTLLRKPKKH